MDKARDPQTKKLISAQALNHKQNILDYVCPECGKPVHFRKAHQGYRTPYFAHNPGTATEKCSLYQSAEGVIGTDAFLPLQWQLSSDWYTPGIVVAHFQGKPVLGELIPGWIREKNSDVLASRACSWLKPQASGRDQPVKAGLYPINLKQNLESQIKYRDRFSGRLLTTSLIEPLVFRWFDFAWRLVPHGNRLEYGEPLLILKKTIVLGLEHIGMIGDYYCYSYCHKRGSLINADLRSVHERHTFQPHSQRLFVATSDLLVLADGRLLADKKLYLKARPTDENSQMRVVWQNLQGKNRKDVYAETYKQLSIENLSEPYVVTADSCPNVLLISATGINQTSPEFQAYFREAARFESQITSDQVWQRLARAWFEVGRSKAMPSSVSVERSVVAKESKPPVLKKPTSKSTPILNPSEAIQLLSAHLKQLELKKNYSNQLQIRISKVIRKAFPGKKVASPKKLQSLVLMLLDQMSPKLLKREASLTNKVGNENYELPGGVLLTKKQFIFYSKLLLASWPKFHNIREDQIRLGQHRFEYLDSAQERIILTRNEVGILLRHVTFSSQRIPILQEPTQQKIVRIKFLAWRGFAWQELPEWSDVIAQETLIIVWHPTLYPDFCLHNTYEHEGFCYSAVRVSQLRELPSFEMHPSIFPYQIRNHLSRLLLKTLPKGFCGGVPRFLGSVKYQLISSTSEGGCYLFKRVGLGKEVIAYPDQTKELTLTDNTSARLCLVTTESLFAPQVVHFITDGKDQVFNANEYDICLADGAKYEAEYAEKFLSVDFAKHWLEKALLKS